MLLGGAWGAPHNDIALLKLYACCMVVWLLAITSWFYDPHLHWAQICVLKVCTCSTKTQLSKHAYQYFNKVSSLADHWRCHHNYWINSKQERTKAPKGVRLYMLCLPHLQARQDFSSCCCGLTSLLLTCSYLTDSIIISWLSVLSVKIWRSQQKRGQRLPSGPQKWKAN